MLRYTIWIGHPCNMIIVKMACVLRKYHILIDTKLLNMNVYSWVFDTRIFLASSIADLEGAKFLNSSGLGCK